MNIRPLYDRIVVKRLDNEAEKTSGGLYIPDSAKEKLDVAPGDKILFGKYSGSEIKLDGEEFLIMREDEVLGILDSTPVAAKKAS